MQCEECVPDSHGFTEAPKKPSYVSSALLDHLVLGDEFRSHGERSNSSLVRRSNDNYRTHLSNHPLSLFLTTDIQVEAQLSEGRIFRSRRIKVPEQWRFVPSGGANQNGQDAITFTFSHRYHGVGLRPITLFRPEILVVANHTAGLFRAIVVRLEAIPLRC